MCFTIDENNPNSQIASEDILVYKVLQPLEKKNFWIRFFKKIELKSYYQDFKYKLGIKYELRNKIKVEYIQRTKDIGIVGLVEEGFHSLINIPDLWKTLYHSNSTIVKCIIPKGSNYFINTKYGEYVSDQIIIKKIIK